MITYTITFSNDTSMNLVFPSSSSLADIRTQLDAEVALGFYLNSTSDFVIEVAE